MTMREIAALSWRQAVLIDQAKPKMRWPLLPGFFPRTGPTMGAGLVSGLSRNTIRYSFLLASAYPFWRQPPVR
jgi:undecaprenyl pyrophosphate phosphatase UppP